MESLQKECKKCGAVYIDPRYYEMAIDGIPEDEYKDYFIRGFDSLCLQI